MVLAVLVGAVRPGDGRRHHRAGPGTPAGAPRRRGSASPTNQPTVIKALAAYDPRAVAALVRALPASARRAPGAKDGWQGASIDAQIRLAAAEALGLSAEERYRKVLGGRL